MPYLNDICNNHNTCHGEYPHYHINIPPSHNGLLHPRPLLPPPLYPGCHDPHHYDDQVEDQQHHQAQYVHLHGLCSVKGEVFYSGLKCVIKFRNTYVSSVCIEVNKCMNIQTCQSF